MSEIKLNQTQKEEIVDKLKNYFNDEMHQEIGQFEAEFLLDFFAKHVGGYFYNQGLQDASKVFENKIEDIQQHLYELEKPSY